MSTSSTRYTLALGAASALLLTAQGAPAASALSAVSTADVAPVAQGKVTFDCILLPFQSAFRYEGNVSIAGPADVEPGSTVEVVGRFPKLPGIAPVPIVDGTMHATALGKVGEQELQLKATSTVNAEPNAEVPMPRLLGQVEMADANVPFELTGFNFVFDKDMGIVISAECEATDGANLGAMASAGDGSDAGNGETKAAAAEEEGMPAVVLGGGALAVVAAGLLFWFSRRARRA